MNPTVALYGDNNLFKEKLKSYFENKGFATSINNNVNAHYSVIVHLTRDLPQYDKLLSTMSGKVLFVFSLIDNQRPRWEGLQKLLTLQTNAKLKTIYIGDLYFENSKFLKNSRFLEIIDGGGLNISPATIFYPVSEQQACDFIVRELFTYAHGQELSISTKTTEEMFAARLQSINPKLVINRNQNRQDQKIILSTHLINTPLDQKTLNSLAQSMKKENVIERPTVFPAGLPKIEPIKFTENNVNKTENKKANYNFFNVHSPFNFKKLFMVFMVIIWFILTPFVALAFSATSLYLGALSLEKTNFTTSQALFTLSQTTAYFSSGFFGVTANIPGVKSVSQTAYGASDLFYKSSLIGKNSIKAFEISSGLLENIISGKRYDINAVSENLFFLSDALYKESLYAYGQYKNLKPLFSGFMPENIKIEDKLKYLYAMRETSRSLGNVLGSDSSKTYLVLLQNNMELRATGGFIGSFALVTFENGKLIDTNVFDVYSADGQLKGFVAPPEPIKKYLGEATWYMRDSNWDPDFVSSAQKAEWFLDKSLNRQVDGVIGVNLEVLRSYLAINGPLEITDFNDTITLDNFYQKIQFEVENDFFPGSRKKTHYLTALTNEILSSLSTLDKKEYLSLIKNLGMHFETRDIQVFMHEPRINHVASVLGWSGELNTACGQFNCKSLWGSLIEDNVGVNKANVNINRRAQLSVEIGEKSVDYSYRVVFSNESKAVGQIPEFGYKAYVRLLTNDTARFEKVIIQNGNKMSEVFPEILNNSEGWVEAGVLLNVAPQEEVMLAYNWTEPVLASDVEQYKLIWRKQSGVSTYPVEIKITNHDHLNIYGVDGFLTEGYNFDYNTALDKDIELYLKK